MQTDEALLIRVHDSADDGRARLSFHTSFENPLTPGGAAAGKHRGAHAGVLPAGWLTTSLDQRLARSPSGQGQGHPHALRAAGLSVGLAGNQPPCARAGRLRGWGKRAITPRHRSKSQVQSRWAKRAGTRINREPEYDR